MAKIPKNDKAWCIQRPKKVDQYWEVHVTNTLSPIYADDQITSRLQFYGEQDAWKEWKKLRMAFGMHDPDVVRV